MINFFLVSSSEKSFGRWKEKIFQVSITLFTVNVSCLNNRSIPPAITEVKRQHFLLSITDLILGKDTNVEWLAFDSADNEGRVVLLRGEMQIMKKGSSSQRRTSQRPRNYLKATLILPIYCFFSSSLQVSEITHHALDNKIDLVMVGKGVRTKGKHQLLISCTQKKSNLFLSNMKNFYSFCEPWHTWWESVDTLLLIKCSTYKAMWQNVYCKFLPFEGSWTRHLVWLWRFIPFPTPLDRIVDSYRGVHW